MAVVKAYEEGQPKVIRGAVQMATAILYKGPTLEASADIQKKDWPFQTNNMTAWWQAAYRALGAPMRVMLGRANELEYEVNDGEGAKHGRDSNSNKFSYILYGDGMVQWRLDIVIITISHQAVHQRRLKEGHMPRKVANWHGLTYLDPRAGTVHQWQDATQDYLVYLVDEYYAEFPELRGKLPCKGIDNPNCFRPKEDS